MEFDLTQLTKMYEAYEKANNRDYAEFLCTKGVLTEAQKDRVIQMIDSKDCENYEVAKMILDTVTKKLPTQKPIQHVNHVQIREPQIRESRSQ